MSLILAIGIQLGAIRKNEDPVLRSQTDPISLKQKNEETKDGVKGAPAPSFNFYDKEEFLTVTPMGVAEEEKALVQQSEMPESSEVFQGETAPEEQALEGAGEESAEEEEDWWTEDTGEDFEAESSSEESEEDRDLL